LLIIAVFAGAAAAALAHALVTSVRRRRRELAILKTLGFTRGQVVATVAWQATTVAATGLLVGLPLGLGVGRFAWNVFASDLEVVPEAVTPIGLTALVVPATIVLANLIAALPAQTAARTRPALVLRAE
jgi:ABC-type lipoprotein release transport system permease subunit